MEIKFIQRLYYSGKFQMFYHKAAVMGTLVLKPCSQCLIETFVSIKHLRLYAPLRIPSKRKRAAWGKILELPEPYNL